MCRHLACLRRFTAQSSPEAVCRRRLECGEPGAFVNHAPPAAHHSSRGASQIAQLNLFCFLFVALLLKVDIDGEGDARFFTGIVGVMSIVPVALPIVIHAYVRFLGSLDARAIAKDSEWE